MLARFCIRRSGDRVNCKRKKPGSRFSTQTHFPHHIDQRNGHAEKEYSTEHATPAGLVVHLIIHGFFGIGDPAHSPGCFEAKVMSDDTLCRCAGSNSLFDGGYAESEFHIPGYYSVVLLANGKTICESNVWCQSGGMVKNDVQCSVIGQGQKSGSFIDFRKCPKAANVDPVSQGISQPIRKFRPETPPFSDRNAGI